MKTTALSEESEDVPQESPEWEPGETVIRVIDHDQLFKTGPKFGYCACQEPADILWQGQSFCIHCVPKRRK